MRKFLLIFLVCGIAAVGGSAFAQQMQKIAAVVNDDVISLYDLQARMALLMAGSNTADTTENRRRLAREVLRRMIDEVLQMQEAKRLSLTVSEAEVEQAIATIERQNGMPKGGLNQFLAAHGLDRSILVGQVEPQLAWSKVIGRRIRPQIQVSPEEISETLARIKAGVGKPEYLLAEIFLRVDEAEDESQIRQVAQRVIQQLQQPGANFAAVARNFSQAASAADGGNLGWVRAEELGDDLAGPVSQMQPGQVVGPIRTLSGFQIILLRDRRVGTGLSAGDAEVQLQQLFFPLAADAPEPQVRETLAKAQAMAARARNCGDMESLAKELGTPMSGSLGKVKMSALPAAVQSTIGELEIGRPSSPMRNENGLAVLMVCERTGQNAEQDQREQIERMITLQRLDAAAQRYLRDLRRAAFIEVRL